MGRTKNCTGAFALLLLTIIAMAGQTAAADLVKPAPRQGYYFSFGAFGAGQFHWDSEESWADPMFGHHVSFRLGEQLTSWFDLGLGFNYGQAWNKDYRTIVGGLTLEGALYPTTNFFIRPGFGFSFTDVTRAAGRNLPKLIGRFGAHYSVAVGHNFFVSKGDYGSGGWSLAPVIQAGVGPGQDFATVTLLIGLEATFWTGLSKDKLKLDFDEAFQ